MLAEFPGHEDGSTPEDGVRVPVGGAKSIFRLLADPQNRRSFAVKGLPTAPQRTIIRKHQKYKDLSPPRFFQTIGGFPCRILYN